MRTGRERVARLGVMVVAGALALTAALVGVLALVSGAAGVRARLPLYAVVTGVAFAIAVVLVESRERGPAADADGRTALGTAVAYAVVTFLIVMLAGEGLTFTARNPTRVLASRILLYLLAVGFAGSGLAYWGLNHWREFAGDAGSGGQHRER